MFCLLAEDFHLSCGTSLGNWFLEELFVGMETLAQRLFVIPRAVIQGFVLLQMHSNVPHAQQYNTD